jgi:glycosyltransferase involved in cell wall biosynthesis
MAGCNRIFFNDHSSRPHGQLAVPLRLSRRIIGRILTAPLTGILSVSDFTRRTGDLLGITSAKNTVVLNGVEVESIDPARRDRFRKQYGIPSDALVVTQVCWMVEMKGVEVMIRAAVMLLRERSGVHFLFVGEGPDLAKYRNLATEGGIASAVTFTGMLNSPTGTGVFDASDIYCQPSIWQEASGLAVMEAMSVKLPIIASDTGGLPEIVQNNKTGILVPVGSSEQIYLTLKRFMDDAGLRHSMGEAGYQLILKEHRIEDMARKYVDLFVGEG